MQVILEFEWSLHSVLFKVKDPLPVEKQSKVVYRIPYCFGKAYTGNAGEGLRPG